MRGADFGTVVGGLVVRGSVREGMAMSLGPDRHGAFLATSVASIQRSCVTVATADAGHHATLALRGVPASAVRRGMVLVTCPNPSRVAQVFETILSPVTAALDTLRVATTGVVHAGPARQSATVTELALTDGVTPAAARVRLSFARGPEYLEIGDLFFFRTEAGFFKGVVMGGMQR